MSISIHKRSPNPKRTDKKNGHPERDQLGSRSSECLWWSECSTANPLPDLGGTEAHACILLKNKHKYTHMNVVHIWFWKALSLCLPKQHADFGNKNLGLIKRTFCLENENSIIYSPPKPKGSHSLQNISEASHGSRSPGAVQVSETQVLKLISKAALLEWNFNHGGC